MPNYEAAGQVHFIQSKVFLIPTSNAVFGLNPIVFFARSEENTDLHSKSSYKSCEGVSYFDNAFACGLANSRTEESRVSIIFLLDPFRSLFPKTSANGTRERRSKRSEDFNRSLVALSESRTKAASFFNLKM